MAKRKLLKSHPQDPLFETYPVDDAHIRRSPYGRRNLVHTNPISPAFRLATCRRYLHIDFMLRSDAGFEELKDSSEEKP